MYIYTYIYIYIVYAYILNIVLHTIKHMYILNKVLNTVHIVLIPADWSVRLVYHMETKPFQFRVFKIKKNF